MKKITYWLFLLIFTISLTSLEAQEKRQTTTQEQEIEAKLLRYNFIEFINTMFHKF